MLRNFKLPGKLKTIQHPGKRVEIWINSRKVEAIEEYSFQDQVFLKKFISNLENMGWIVLT